jgi:hypothetical protein
MGGIDIAEVLADNRGKADGIEHGIAVGVIVEGKAGT